MIIRLTAELNLADSKVNGDQITRFMLRFDLAPLTDHPGMAGLLVGRQIAIMGRRHPAWHQHFYVPAQQFAFIVTQHVTDKAVDLKHDATAIDANHTGGSTLNNGFITRIDGRSAFEFRTELMSLYMQKDKLLSLPCQQLKLLQFCSRKLTGPGIDQTEGANHMAGGTDGNTCIKPDIGLCGDQRVGGKCRIPAGIIHHQRRSVRNHVIAERDVAGGLGCTQALRGLEPLTITVKQ